MSYDPLPASGSGADVFDQPSLFYLTNRTQIDEWYGLRANVSEAVGEWYRTTVREALASPAADRLLDVTVVRGPGSYHHVLLHTPDATILDTKPVIGIGFAWPSKTVDPSTDSIFACVRCSRNETGRIAATQFLDAGGRTVRAGLRQAKGGDTETWPIWWWIRAKPHWWTDLDSYCAMLVEEVTLLADAARQPLEAASRVPAIGSVEETE